MSFVKIMITCVFVNASMYCADFDSLFINSFPVYETLSYQEKMRWQPLIKAYNEHIAQRPVYSVVARIPKIIHQIWLGGQLPERLKLMQQTVIDLHPDWEYRLWTDADIAEFGLINQDLFDACNNWGQKSDIARYEIIYRLGGVYIDSDIQCVKPLDDIHHICDFYAGADGGWLTENEVVVCNAFFGARPGHPILLELLNTITVTENKPDDEIDKVVYETGPVPFTNAIMKEQGKKGAIDIVFPPSYFYPFSWTIRTTYTLNEINEYLKKGALIPRLASWIRPETYVIHYWAATWYESWSFLNQPE